MKWSPSELLVRSSANPRPDWKSYIPFTLFEPYPTDPGFSQDLDDRRIGSRCFTMFCPIKTIDGCSGTGKTLKTQKIRPDPIRRESPIDSTRGIRLGTAGGVNLWGWRDALINDGGDVWRVMFLFVCSLFFWGGVLGHGLRETKCWHFGLVLAFGTCEF